VLLATLLVPGLAGAHDLIAASGFDEPAEGPYNRDEAARFLIQATFGPTRAEIDRLAAIGYHAWLSEQITATPTRHLPLVDARIQQMGVDNVWDGERHEEWFRVAMTANDQLRQRVAFALSQLLVVSYENGALEGNPTTLADYYDVLVRNAFGNYRTLLEEVTLHPAMGQYLSMFKNRKANQSGTIRPDENYAREIMQLFSVGLIRLNPDGTPMDADGNPANGIQTIPTYNQDTIRGFAAVFTGWNWSTCVRTLGGPGQPPEDADGDGEYDRWWEWEWCPIDPVANTNWKLARAFRTPMTPWQIYHQSAGTKQLLAYPGVARGRVNAQGVLAAGGTAQQNLAEALDNVFHHPNVGPFVARHLIQRLVTSNPTPGYVQRVAAVFDDDNGAAPGGVRGNLGAVVRAVLLDAEARRPTTQACTSASTGCVGKLREPLLTLTRLNRAMAGRPTTPNGVWQEGWPEYSTAQAALRSPTVFNFYLPHYALPHPEIAGRGLVSPEFQITVDTYIVRMANMLNGRIHWQWLGNPGLPTSGSWRPTVIDLGLDTPIADRPDQLIARYDTLFTGGTMSRDQFQLLSQHVAGIPFVSWRPEAETRRLRVQDALWLMLVSPEYAVEK
jgi:uncharacterized protein (DUF1800 family)